MGLFLRQCAVGMRVVRMGVVGTIVRINEAGRVFVKWENGMERGYKNWMPFEREKHA